MSKTEKSTTTWYLGKFDADTNEVISRRTKAEIPAISCSEILCKDGVRRELWEMSYEMITEFKKSKKRFNLNFKVFKKDGGHGKPYQFDFDSFPKKPKPSQKEAQDFLNNLAKKQNKKG